MIERELPERGHPSWDPAHLATRFSELHGDSESSRREFVASVRAHCVSHDGDFDHDAGDDLLAAVFNELPKDGASHTNFVAAVGDHGGPGLLADVFSSFTDTASDKFFLAAVSSQGGPGLLADVFRQFGTSETQSASKFLFIYGVLQSQVKDIEFSKLCVDATNICSGLVTLPSSIDLTLQLAILANLQKMTDENLNQFIGSPTSATVMAALEVSIPTENRSPVPIVSSQSPANFGKSIFSVFSRSNRRPEDEGLELPPSPKKTPLHRDNSHVRSQLDEAVSKLIAGLPASTRT